MLTSYLPAPSLTAPSIPSASPVYALSAVTSGVALSSFAVSAAASEARIENRLQGGSVNVPAAPAMETETVAGSSAAASSAALPVGGMATGPRFSSPFLAQLIGQFSPQERASLAGQFVVEGEPSTVLDVRLIDLFSQVKYKPSNASKPSVPVSNVQVLLNAAEISSRRDDMALRSATQAPLMQAANGNLRLPPASNDNRPVFRPEPTLVRTSGISAYAASIRRNDTIRDAVPVEAIPESAPAPERSRTASAI